MKKLIKILAIILVSLNANCQVTTIVPLRTLDYPNGAYLKDLDNEYPFWEGVWEGTSDGKKYIFTFVLIEQQLISFENSYKYTDRIICKLKVIDLSNNQTIYDESSFSNYNDFKIIGLLIKGNYFHFGLFDNESNCFNRAEFILQKNASNPNQILYKDFNYQQIFPVECPYGNQSSIPMFLPRTDLVLTRQ